MSKSQRGASYYQTGKYLSQLRVFSEIFISEMPHVESSFPACTGRAETNETVRTLSQALKTTVRATNQETSSPVRTLRAETKP
jgi:hypothetical protein